MDKNRLTRREEDVIRLMMLGLTDKQIAYRMGLSSRTASFHLTNAYKKLGAHSRVGAYAAYQKLRADEGKAVVM